MTGDLVNGTDICKKFGNKTVFDHFNFGIERGEFVCIMGASGSGKTTLLNMIGLLVKPDFGKLSVFGEVNPGYHTGKGREILRSKISYLFQNCGMIEEETVGYNLQLAERYLHKSRKEKDAIRRTALEKVGLEGMENNKIYTLSGGEQQRAAMAAACIKPSELILADEPTGNLDTHNRDLVFDILAAMNKEGKTIVMATHDPAAEKYASRVLRLL